MNFFRKKEQTKEPEKAAAVSVQTAAETPPIFGASALRAGRKWDAFAVHKTAAECADCRCRAR